MTNLGYKVGFIFALILIIVLVGSPIAAIVLVALAYIHRHDPVCATLLWYVIGLDCLFYGTKSFAGRFLDAQGLK